MVSLTTHHFGWMLPRAWSAPTAAASGGVCDIVRAEPRRG